MYVKHLISRFLFLSVLILSLKETLFAAEPIKNGSKAFKAFAPKLATKYQMEFLNTGIGAIVDSRVVAWDISLMDHRILTLEQARPMVVGMIQDALYEIYHNPIYTEYLKETARQVSWYDPVLTPKRFGMKIAFWDKDVNRPCPPYLSQIKVSEGLIHYYYANPDQSLGSPITETFEQAYALVQKQQQTSI